MDTLSQKQVTEFLNDMKKFLDRLNAEREHIREEVTSIKLNLSGSKVCDFGCGLGFTTFGLASVLNFSEVIGVDKDANVIDQAQIWIEAVKIYIQLIGETRVEEDELESQARDFLRISSTPKFRVGDVVSGENLPVDIDFAYCRKVLTPIALGEFENLIPGQEGIATAIENITRSVKQAGYLLMIEKASNIVDFKEYFTQAGLELVAESSVLHKDILKDGSKGLVQTSYSIYTLRKL